MSFWSRLFGTKAAKPVEDDSERDEHAVLVYLKLSDDEYGTTEERERVFELEDRLEDAITRRGAGEFDGNEFGGGFGELYMYGPNADTLSDAISETLRAFPKADGSYLVKRYGPPGATEQRIEL